jgi:Cu/Ag efflux pump CusA
MAGGKSKTYDVTVDLKRLNDAGLTLAQVVQALNNNVNVGGQTINFGQHAAVVLTHRWAAFATRFYLPMPAIRCSFKM